MSSIESGLEQLDLDKRSSSSDSLFFAVDTAVLQKKSSVQSLSELRAKAKTSSPLFRQVFGRSFSSSSDSDLTQPHLYPRESSLPNSPMTQRSSRTSSLSNSTVFQTEIALPATVRSDERNAAVLRRCNTIETDSIDRKQNETGEAINDYKLCEVLGNGSYGIVHRVEKNGENYAMKCLSKKKLKRKGFAGRKASMRDDGLSDLKQEIAILRRLTHPYIVRLVEVMNDPKHDMVYMVFELMTLGPVMNMGSKTVAPFAERQACLYFRQLVLAVEFLHTHYVIHRDIKPENILLYRHDHIKVSDFGVSHIFEQDSDVLLSKTAGTPAFMAPEAVNVAGMQFEGRPVDVWAMGVTLYCFLYACLPFTSDSLFDLQATIRASEPSYTSPATPTVSSPCHTLLMELFRKNPRERITISGMRSDAWLNSFDFDALPSEFENTNFDTDVTDEEVRVSMTEIVPAELIVLLQNRRRTTASRSRMNSSDPVTLAQHESFSGKLEAQNMHRVVPLFVSPQAVHSPLRTSCSHIDVSSIADPSSSFGAPVALKLELEDDEPLDNELLHSASAVSDAPDHVTSFPRMSVSAPTTPKKPTVRASMLGAVLRTAPSSGV